MTSPNPTAHRFRIVAFVALGYWLLAASSYSAFSSPIYAIPVFPAAGLALAMSLVYGRWGIAGIWLGSFVLQPTLVLMKDNSADLSPITFWVAIAVASGSALQAAAGRALLERWLPVPWQRLDNAVDALYFIIAGGIISTLVSATTGSCTLYLLDQVDASTLGQNWGHWYVGDSLGVIIITPLVLAFLLHKDSLWKERRKYSTIPTLALLCLLILTFVSILEWENGNKQQRLEKDSFNLTERIKDRLQAHKDVLRALAHFIEVTPDIYFDQFEAIASGILQDNPDLSALSLNAWITDERRSAFEKQISMISPTGDYHIKERDANKQLVTANHRAYYAPVQYIVPLPQNQTAIGYDIFSEPTRHEAIEEIRQGSSFAVTAPIQLVQDSKQRIGLLELSPIEAMSHRHPNNKPNLQGFSVGVIQVEEMMQIALRDQIPNGLLLRLVDDTVPNNPNILFNSPEFDPDLLTQAGKIAFQVGERHWTLYTQPSAVYASHTQGSVVWFVAGACLLLGALLQAFMLDVTGRAVISREKQARALQNSEKRYQHLFNNNPQPAWVYDVNSLRILMVNEAAIHYYGWSREEFLQMRLTDLLPIDEPTYWLDSSHQPHTTSYYAECRRRCRDGTIINSMLRSTPFHDDNGDIQLEVLQEKDRFEIRSALTALHDMVEEKLHGVSNIHINPLPREPYQSLSSLSDRISEFIYQIYNKTQRLSQQKFALDQHAIVSVTDKNGIITYVNDLFCSASGYAMDELIGRKCNWLDSGHVESALAEEVRQHLHTGKIWHGETSDRHKSGTTFWTRITIVPILNRQGELEEIISVRTDITADRLAQLKLEEAKQLAEKAKITAEQASKAKSSFLANMSHEFRTPLNSLLGLAQVLRRTPLNGEQQDMVRRICDSGNFLLTQTNDVLDFSKIEAGQMLLEKEPFKLQSLLNKLEDIMHNPAKDRGLALRVQGLSVFSKTLVGDSTRLLQILINLVGNAIKFTPHGTVTTQVTLLHRDDDEVQLLFEVTDTGIGISVEKQNILFTPFTQADSSITRLYGGTGLGLSICKHLVELMHGHIGVRSTEGQGSTFWFEAPFRVSALEPKLIESQVQSSQPRLVGQQILVVDDNEMNRITVKHMLKLEGATCIECENGRQAIDLLQHEHPPINAVLMDVQMPVIDGFQATRMIRDELGLKALPIYICSAGIQTEDVILACGANQLIRKPIVLENLIEHLLALPPAPSAAPISTTAAASEMQPQNSQKPPIDSNHWPEIEGIACEAMRVQFGEDKDFFLMLLSVLSHDLHGALTDMLEQINTDSENAARRLHKLRGSAGSLGATALVHISQELEDAIKQQKPDWHLPYQKFETEVQALLQHLAPYTGPSQQA